MPRATICVDSRVPEQAIVESWLDRWRDRLTFVSENESCGCCVHLYRVEAPRDALDELPPIVFASSEWSHMCGAKNPVVVSAAETALRCQADAERFEWFKRCAPREFADQDFGELRSLYQDGDELWTFRTDDKTWKERRGWEGYALLREGKVIGAVAGEQG